MTSTRTIGMLSLFTFVVFAVIATGNPANTSPKADAVTHVAWAVNDLPIHRLDANGGYQMDIRLLMMWIKAEIGSTPGFTAGMKGPYDIPQKDGDPVSTLFVMVTATPDAHKQLAARFDELRIPSPRPDPRFTLDESGKN